MKKISFKRNLVAAAVVSLIGAGAVAQVVPGDNFVVNPAGGVTTNLTLGRISMVGLTGS